MEVELVSLSRNQWDVFAPAELLSPMGRLLDACLVHPSHGVGGTVIVGRRSAVQIDLYIDGQGFGFERNGTTFLVTSQSRRRSLS